MACPHVPRFLRNFTLCPHGVRHTRYRAYPCTGVLSSHAFRKNAPQPAFDNLSVGATVLDYQTQSKVLIHPVIQIPFGHHSYKYSHTLLFAISVRRKCYQMLVHAHHNRGKTLKAVMYTRIGRWVGLSYFSAL